MSAAIPGSRHARVCGAGEHGARAIARGGFKCRRFAACEIRVATKVMGVTGTGTGAETGGA